MVVFYMHAASLFIDTYYFTSHLPDLLNVYGAKKSMFHIFSQGGRLRSFTFILQIYVIRE